MDAPKTYWETLMLWTWRSEYFLKDLACVCEPTDTGLSIKRARTWRAGFLFVDVNCRWNVVSLGSWSLQLEGAGQVCILRSLLWPGLTFYHVLMTPQHGYIYIGSGMKNLDLPFMLWSQPTPCFNRLNSAGFVPQATMANAKYVFSLSSWSKWDYCHCCTINKEHFIYMLELSRVYTLNKPPSLRLQNWPQMMLTSSWHRVYLKGFWKIDRDKMGVSRWGWAWLKGVTHFNKQMSARIQTFPRAAS